MFPTWLLGVLLAIAASVVSNLGLNLQKRAHMNMSAREKEHQSSAHGALTASQQKRYRTSSVSFADEQSSNNTPEKSHPISPSGGGSNGSGGILKKSNGKSNDSYHRLSENENSDGEYNTPPRQQQRRAQLPTIPQSPATLASPPINGVLTDAEPSPHFYHPEPKSYTSLNEISQGGIDLDNYGPVGRTNSTSAAPNGYTTRGRSSSASNAVARRDSRNSLSAANGGGSRRRSSVNIDGVTVQQKKPAIKQGHYTKQPIWIVGLICVILGSLLDFTALAFVDQAVVAPLGSLTLVSNVFFAPILLKEKVTRKQIGCTILIVAGSCLAVAFAPHSSASPNIDAMFNNFAHPRFIVYGIVCVSALIGLRVACWKFNKIRRNDPHGAYVKIARYHTFSYAACAGIMGAQSVLFAKCTAMLLASSIAGDGLMFVYWGSYFVLLALGVTIFLQIRWLNSGLRMFSALMIVPIFQSFWILVSVIAGMIFFGEYEGVFTQPANAVLFPFGLILTISGVYLLTQIKPPGTEDTTHPIAHRRRSRSSARASSLSGVSGLTPHHGGNTLNSVTTDESVTSSDTATANGGVVTTPLMKSMNGDHYGVPQSPRDTPPMVQPTRKLRPAPIAANGVGINGPPLDRTVDLGSYSQEENERYLSKRDEANELDDTNGDEVESGSSGSDEDSERDPSVDYSDYAVHSMAPLNFPLFLLPQALLEQPASPRPYFEENSSGFHDPNTSEIGMGGLTYNSIFKVREENDEENPANGTNGDQVIPAAADTDRKNSKGINGRAIPAMSPQDYVETEWTVPANATNAPPALTGSHYPQPNGLTSGQSSAASSVFSPTGGAFNAITSPAAFSPAYISPIPSVNEHSIDLSSMSSDATYRNGGLLESASNVSEFAAADNNSSSQQPQQQSSPARKTKQKKKKSKSSFSRANETDSPLEESLL